jgi:MFS transporter, DHA2 family, multidrug resistance protein
MAQTLIETPRPPGAVAWAGFAAMCLGMFMAILDIQVVVTSLPVIQDALAIGADRMSWVQTAYLIAEIIAIPLTGLFTRALGMRWLFIIATAVFVIASIACALSFDFASLIAARVIQGFAGGVLIPLVFAGVFHLFPEKHHAAATTIAGVTAVLAPTLGPMVGGWITENLSWHWLFLINIVPGLIAITVAAAWLPRERTVLGRLRRIDWLSLFLLAIALAALEIAIKEAPDRGWTSLIVLGLLALSVVSATCFALRTLSRSDRIVDIGLFADRNFAAGSLLSFALGAALFGMVYLMPVFLSFVRGHGPLRIGEIMLVTGGAQLVMAPIAAYIDRRFPAGLLAFAGFAVFAIGLWMSSTQTADTDFDGMFWPQIVRGAAAMLCLVVPTRIALGQLGAHQIDDGSSLFNMMRNLGGAIGISLIDTVLFTRGPQLAEDLTDKLKAGDPATLDLFGMTAADVTDGIDSETLMSIMPDIEQLSVVLAVNEAWLLLAGIALLALPALLVVRRTVR